MPLPKIEPSITLTSHSSPIPSGLSGILQDEVVQETRDAVASGRLYRCLTCDAITHWHTPVEWLQPGGKLYQLARDTNKGPLTESRKYNFPQEGEK